MINKPSPKKLIAVGKIIRNQRKKLGLSQEAVADGLNLQQNAISSLEQGQYGGLGALVERLEKILLFPPGGLRKYL